MFFPPPWHCSQWVLLSFSLIYIHGHHRQGCRLLEYKTNEIYTYIYIYIFIYIYIYEIFMKNLNIQTKWAYKQVNNNIIYFNQSCKKFRNYRFEYCNDLLCFITYVATVISPCVDCLSPCVATVLLVLLCAGFIVFPVCMFLCVLL